MKILDLDLCRTLTKMLVSAIFLFQMQHSIYKYYNKPVVSQSSTESFYTIRTPVIYVCEEAQFNYTTAEKFGYGGPTKFAMGMLIEKKKNLTWMGNFKNLTFKKLQEEIFDFDYNNLEVKYSTTGDKEDYINQVPKNVNLFPFGFCTKLENIEQYTKIRLTTKSLILYVDPRKESSVYLPRMKNGEIEAGRTSHHLFEKITFEIEIRIHDSRINDGSTCKDYDQVGESFGNCVENDLKETYHNSYNCLPPWISDSEGETCEEDKEIQLQDIQTIADMKNKMSKFNHGVISTLNQTCLPPCLEMSLTLNKKYHLRTVTDRTTVQIKFLDQILVSTDVYSYDLFNLVVDLGSALGLWLGLSALSIIENILISYQCTVRKYNH